MDGEVVDAADGRLAWARFEALVEGKVAAAAPEVAAAREKQAALERSVRRTRVNRHGNATLIVKADAPTVETIDAAIAFLAEQLKERFPDTCLDERRVHALSLLANPDAHLDPDVGPAAPRVVVYLHLYGESPIARLEGNGPVTTTWVKHLLAGTLAAGPGGIDLVNAPNVKITPVLDPVGQAPVDAYEIPARLRTAVRILHPGDVFPFAASLSRRLDLDHAIPHAQGGPTGVGNLAPLTRTHHRIKTHHRENGRGWEVRHPNPLDHRVARSLRSPLPD